MGVRISYSFCNRLPTLCRDTRSSLGRLQDGVNATLYIDRRSILLADHCSHFSYLLPHYTLLPPHSSCIYRASRATFTIKSFMHSHTLQSSQFLYSNGSLIVFLLTVIQILLNYYLTAALNELHASGTHI